MAPVIVRYKNSFADLLWYMAHYNARSPVVVVVYTLFAAYALYMVYTARPGNGLVHLASVVIVWAAIVVLFVVVTGVALALATISRANRTILTEHTITLTETGLIEETRFNRSEYTWDGIPRLTRTRRHIFVYVSQRGAHVIPRRAFSDAAAWDGIFAELQARIRPRG